MTSGERLAWLAGIVDGEGHFGIYAQKPRKSWWSSHITTVFHLGNTSLPMILRVKEILLEIIGREIRYVTVKKNNRMLFYYLRFHDGKAMRSLCEALLPYLVARRAQAEMMIEYLKIAPKEGYKYGGPASKLTDAHFAYVSAMKHLNRTFRKEHSLQRETERQAPMTVDETVQATRRRVEAAEMTARLLPFEKVAK